MSIRSELSEEPTYPCDALDNVPVTLLQHAGLPVQDSPHLVLGYAPQVEEAMLT
jgi:hypothetical protein